MGPQQGPHQPTTADIVESYKPPVTCSFAYFRCPSIVVFGLSGGGGVGSNPTGGTLRIPPLTWGFTGSSELSVGEVLGGVGVLMAG